MSRIKRLFSIWVLCGVLLATVTPAITETAFAQEAGAPQVIIEVKGSTESDDYLCWSPVPARIRLAVPSAYPATVTLSSAGQATGGAVWFQVNDGTRPTPATFSPSEELRLSLPGDGTWVHFWIAGNRASNGGKDVTVMASDNAGNELGSLPVMVRVRKDAETLTPIEIAQFLSALAEVHDLRNGALNTQYYKHSRAHDEAFFVGIHQGMPLFLAWHRALLINLDRELQAVDPRVAMPYWRYDRLAPNTFTPEFMGTTRGGASTPGGFLVEFSPTNPIRGWQMNDGRGGLVRQRDAAEALAIPEDRLNAIFQVAFNAQYTGINGALEFGYHNGAHSFILGWIGTRSSPRDPLFYLLHTNTDRAWAHWQAQFSRFNPADSAAYSAQGDFAAASGPNRFRKGSYAQDAMWPWSGEGGDQGTSDPMDDWPELSYSMPTVPGAEGPTLPPRPADMVDYLDVAGQGLSHGTCYDDIDYFGRPIGAGN